MVNKKIRVGFGETISLGKDSFESLRVDVAVEAELENSETIEQAQKVLSVEAGKLFLMTLLDRLPLTDRRQTIGLRAHLEEQFNLSRGKSVPCSS